MKPLAIDKYGIVRQPDGQRRGNEPNGFDIRQLDVVPTQASEEELEEIRSERRNRPSSNAARRRVQERLKQMQKRRSIG